MHETPGIDTVPALGKLALGEIGPDESPAFLIEAETEVREVMRWLGVAYVTAGLAKASAKECPTDSLYASSRYH